MWDISSGMICLACLNWEISCPMGVGPNTNFSFQAAHSSPAHNRAKQGTRAETVSKQAPLNKHLNQRPPCLVLSMRANSTSADVDFSEFCISSSANSSSANFDFGQFEFGQFWCDQFRPFPPYRPRTLENTGEHPRNTQETTKKQSRNTENTHGGREKGAPTKKSWEKGGPEGWGPKYRAFFHSPAPFSLFCSLSLWGLFVEFWPRCKAEVHPKSAFGLLWFHCKPRRLAGRQCFHKREKKKKPKFGAVQRRVRRKEGSGGGERPRETTTDT